MIRAEPCWRCQARGSCRHREVEDIELPPIGRLSAARKGNLNSPWGKHGNPAGKARDRILDAMKAQLRPGERTSK